MVNLPLLKAKLVLLPAINSNVVDASFKVVVLYLIGRHVLVSVNTAFAGTLVSTVNPQATGLPLLKYTGLVELPAPIGLPSTELLS